MHLMPRSCDSLSEVEQRHGDPAQSLHAAALLPLLLRSSGRRQRAGVQRHRQLRLSGQLVDLHRETHPAGGVVINPLSSTGVCKRVSGDVRTSGPRPPGGTGTC